MATYYSGRVHSVVYSNVAQAFYILRVTLDDPSLVSPTDMVGGQVFVRGSVTGISVRVGAWFGFEAAWATHATYGRQLAIIRAPVFKKAWDAESAERALVAHGVGERVIQSVRAHFKTDDTFLFALQDETQLLQVPSVNDFLAKHIHQRWLFVQAYFRSIGFLNDLGLPSGKVRQVWALFGDEAEQVLGKNPWELVRVDGITFEQTDEVAKRLSLPLDDPNRIRGAVIYATKASRSFGNLYLSAMALFGEVQRLVPEAVTDTFAKALATAHKEGLVVYERGVREGVRAVYTPWAHKLETDSAKALLERIGNVLPPTDIQDYKTRLGHVGPQTEALAKDSLTPLPQVVAAAVAEWGTTAKLALTEKQAQGVANALLAPVSILTGLPGTGKTTCMLAVVSILKDMGVPYLLCAPTGIAAKNLAIRSNALAYTVHRALSAQGGGDNSKRDATYSGITGTDTATSDGGGSEAGEAWGCNAASPHPAQVVVIDESSMLDQHLLYRLLVGTSPTCRLVFVGDAAQLPSVGAGNVLRDLINSHRFPTVNLTEIFRQADTSGIIYAAHAIFSGQVPRTDWPDFRLVPTSGDEHTCQRILELAEVLYDRRANFQVLSPRHAGPVGVTTLNEKLRPLLNPSGGNAEVRVGSDTIREDDRIMVIRNDYELGVFNGDVGKVSRIDRKAKTVEIKIFNGPNGHAQVVAVPFDDVSSLIRLAYACTVHKMQGLEVDVVIVPVVESFRHQLQRNLLYTAITRAKKKVLLVGTAKALALAVANDKEDQRNSLFCDRLLEAPPLPLGATPPVTA